MRRSTCNRLPAASRPAAPTPSIPGFIGSAFVYPRAGMTDAKAMLQMAEDMRQAGQREGGISENDLELLGFSPRQIRELGPNARRLAQRLSEMTI